MQHPIVLCQRRLRHCRCVLSVPHAATRQLPGVILARTTAALRQCSTSAAPEALETCNQEDYLPPWRRRKPWRWHPEESEQAGFFKLPATEQAPEQGQTLLIGVGSIGVVYYFLFVWWQPS
mmetsp:Transcript_38728/g.76758  ORF Transcript_38728/g.76758 Transcript_38728/m.76758 type:complete len:121 (+) Transcript_38728:80-442(+)